MKLFGTICGYTALIAGGFAIGYLIGSVLMWLLTVVFGSKIALWIYTIIWLMSCIWLFLFVFDRDKYGFRA
jgi:hypothetical protein